MTKIKLPGLKKYGNITLKKGIRINQSKPTKPRYISKLPRGVWARNVLRIRILLKLNWFLRLKRIL